MTDKIFLHKAATAGFISGAALLALLTGCVARVDGPGGGIYVAPPVVEVGVQDNYVYYPSYGVYYNSNRRLFAYMDGGVWVSRPEPMGVSVDVLLGSPSVRMDFHDAPANHHAEMVRRYPGNGSGSGAPHVQRSEVRKEPVKKAPAKKVNGKEEKHDEHEGK